MGMETLTLRSLKQPSRVEVVLHELLQHLSALPQDAYDVCDIGELPAGLRQVATTAKSIGQACSCWTDDRRQHWLFVAEMSRALSRERGVPVLQVDQYGDDGELKETGRWVNQVNQ